MRAVSGPSRLALAVGILAVASGAVTYALLSGLTPYTPTRTGLVVMLLVNLALGLTLGALIAWRLVRLWAERKSGRAGARLHVRLVTWFSLIAVVPAITVAVFASVTLNLGLDAMFSGQVKGALDNAVNVAQIYVKEHESSITGDAGTIADGIQHDGELFDEEQRKSGPDGRQARGLTQDRGLQASYIVDSKRPGCWSAPSRPSSAIPPPTAADFTYARSKGPVIDARRTMAR